MPKAIILDGSKETVCFVDIILESDVSPFAKSNFDIDLSDEQLNLVAQGLREDEAAYDCLMQAIYRAIEYAIESSTDEI